MSGEIQSSGFVESVTFFKKSAFELADILPLIPSCITFGKFYGFVCVNSLVYYNIPLLFSVLGWNVKHSGSG